MAELIVSVDVRAPADEVWARLVDWPSHRSWMLLTDVRPVTVARAGVGSAIEAVTKLGPLRLRDPMTVTQWHAPPAVPARCVVDHTGAVVRGSGAFEVEAVAAGTSRVTWSEWVVVPFGLAGEVGWAVVVRPLLRVGLAISLRRLARQAESQR